MMMLFFEITEIDPVGRGTWKGQVVEIAKEQKDRGECDETRSVIAIEEERKRREGKERGPGRRDVCMCVWARVCASYPEDEADQASSGRELRRSRGKGVSLFKERSR